MFERRGTGAALVACLAIGVVILSAFFLLDIQRTATTIWALAIMIFSDITFFIGLVFTGLLKERYNKVFVISGLATVLTLYLTTSTLTGVVVWFGGITFNTYLFLQFLLHALSVVLFAAIVTFAPKVSAGDARSSEEQRANEINKPEQGGF